jgi:hypothetical protein
VRDPIVVAAAIGLLASAIAGKALVYGLQSVPERWRRTIAWLIVGGAAAVAIVGTS